MDADAVRDHVGQASGEPASATHLAGEGCIAVVNEEQHRANDHGNPQRGAAKFSGRKISTNLDGVG